MDGKSINLPQIFKTRWGKGSIWTELKQRPSADDEHFVIKFPLFVIASLCIISLHIHLMCYSRAEVGGRIGRKNMPNTEKRKFMDEISVKFSLFSAEKLSRHAFYVQRHRTELQLQCHIKLFSCCCEMHFIKYWKKASEGPSRVRSAEWRKRIGTWIYVLRAHKKPLAFFAEMKELSCAILQFLNKCILR